MCNQVSHIYQETFKEMEEELKYSCAYCGDKFNEGRRYSKDNDLLFCKDCVVFEHDLVFLKRQGLTLCQIYNVTMNECEILK